MKTFALVCPELPERAEKCRAHLRERGVVAEFLPAIHAETFGILSWRPYRDDYPNQGYLSPMSQVGCTLSHYMTWMVCANLPDEYFMILEDDARLNNQWKEDLEEAMNGLDFDILLVGSSNTQDKPRTHLSGRVWDVRYPFCTHAYVINRRCLPFLLSEGRDASLKIDILLIKRIYPKLKVLTILPRLARQEGTDLLP